MRAIPVVFGCLAALLIALVVMTIKAEMKWARFAEANGCAAFAQEPGFYTTTWTYAGNNTYVPSMTYHEGARHWRCNDGKEYRH